MPPKNVVPAEELAALPWTPFPDKRAVYRAHGAGLPRIQIGRRVVYDLHAVRAWLESCRAGDWTAAETKPNLRRVV